MKKKYLLSVQGEGRGHVTQAMTLYELLIANGHEVCAIILGSSGKRDIPTFFINKVKAPIIQLQSPNFVTDKKNKSINVTKSVIHLSLIHILQFIDRVCPRRHSTVYERDRESQQRSINGH